MNWLKVLYRSGRQDIVRQLGREYVNPDTIADLVTAAVALALEKGAEHISDERVAQIAIGCERGGNALIHITAAVAPNGDGGKTVTAGEKALICSDLKLAVGSLVTKEALEDAIEAIAIRVK